MPLNVFLFVFQVPPPFKPVVKGPDDTSNFDPYDEEPLPTSAFDKYAREFAEF